MNNPFSVYMVGNIGLRWVKIGYAQDLKTRCSTLQSSVPFPLERLAHWVCRTRDEAIVLERLLHDRVTSKRIRGEWFNLTISEVVELAEYAKRNVLR